MKRVLFVPDLHAPYHHALAWKLALKCAKKLRPDVVVVLGDWFDCYSISRYSKDPARKANLLEELQIGSLLLTQLEMATPNAARHFVYGNHEKRLQDFIANAAPQLHGLVSLSDVLDLPGRGWAEVPYGRGMRLGATYITHDVGNAGIRAHAQARDCVGRGVVIGHTHLMSVEYRESVGRSGVAIAAMFGTLADRSKADYAHEAKAHLWTLGIGVGLLRDDVMHVNPVPFVPFERGLEAMMFGELVRV